MGRVPRAAEREGSAGTAGRCPWLWSQGQGSGSWHLLSPCREVSTAPARPDRRRLLCPCAVNGEPAGHDGQGRGQPASQGTPSPSAAPHPGSHPSLAVPDPKLPVPDLTPARPPCVPHELQGQAVPRQREPGSVRSHLAKGHGASSDVAKRALKGGGTWPSCQPFAPLLRQGSR